MWVGTRWCAHWWSICTTSLLFCNLCHCATWRKGFTCSHVLLLLVSSSPSFFSCMRNSNRGFWKTWVSSFNVMCWWYNMSCVAHLEQLMLFTESQTLWTVKVTVWGFCVTAVCEAGLRRCAPSAMWDPTSLSCHFTVGTHPPPTPAPSSRVLSNNLSIISQPLRM